jgi:hypothetical protein
LAHGLLENDNEWHDCLLEASVMHTGEGLRWLFAIILKHCDPSQPDVLWEHFKESLSDDLPQRFHRSNITPPPQDDIFDYALFLLNHALTELGTSLSNYPSMPQPRENWDVLESNPYINEQMAYIVEYESVQAIDHLGMLNEEQLHCYNSILDSTIQQNGRLFFLNGMGGTGKTFIYKTLCHCIRLFNWIVLCVASSGVAALLLPGGQTAHSMFAIPTENLADDLSCNIKKNSKQADMLRKVCLIIWDEAVM